MPFVHSFPHLTPQERRRLIPDGAFVGFSGFTAGRRGQAVPRALRERARDLHQRGERSRSASSPAPPRAGTSTTRWPRRRPSRGAQPIPVVEDAARPINRQEVAVRGHAPVRNVPQTLAFGFFGKLDFSRDRGHRRSRLTAEFYLNDVGRRLADVPPVRGEGHHRDHRYPRHGSAKLPDICQRAGRRTRPESPCTTPREDRLALLRRGSRKVVAVVRNEEPDERGAVQSTEQDGPRDRGQGGGVPAERDGGRRIPKQLPALPVGRGQRGQRGAGTLGEHPDIPPFEMYTEVYQDSCVDLMEKGRLVGASTTALTISPPQLERIYDAMDFSSRGS